MSEKKAVCIFEDSKDIQFHLRFFFAKHGFEPHVREDALDAVAVVRRHAPALILLDLNMPGKDGLEACRELRADGVRAHIAILTASDLGEVQERALAAGADVCLAKPFRLSHLDALLASLK